MTAARRPGDEPMTCPRLAPSEVAMITASLEMRARVYLTSAALLGEANAALAERDRAAAENCRLLAARLHRLHSCTKGNRA
jgi:hypothetical protein